LRVIALSYKPLHSIISEDQFVKLEREEVECDLIFLGFLVFINKMKDETYKAIEELKAANIKSIMATGDHGLTAISVAKKCKIIDHEKPCYFGDLVSNDNDQKSV